MYGASETSTGRFDIGNDYDYKYPRGLDWRPTSRLHNDTVTWIMSMMRDGSHEFRKRFSKFNRIEQVLSSQLIEQEDDKPNYIIVPQTAYILDTILTHYITAFSSGPLFEYRPVGPEDRVPAMLAELVIQHQCEAAKVLLNLYIQFRDSIAFGLGIVHPKWDVKYGKKTVKKQLTYYSEILEMTLPKYGGRQIRETTRGIIDEGNCLENVQIRSYIPDPNRAAHEVQKFAFAGWVERTSYEELLTRERDDPKTWFNVKRLDKAVAHLSELRDHGKSPTVNKNDDKCNNYYHPVDILHTYCWVIPKDRKLGDNPYPELWVFGVVGDSLIVRAAPVDLDHNMIPLAVAMPIFDGYSISPSSLLELIFMLQEKTSELYSLHMHNLINAVANRVIVDPWIVNYADVVSNTPGGAIKIREHMWGRGVQNAVEQLKFNDATHNFMSEIQNNGDLMQRVTGAVDSLQGIPRTGGERRSATEMRDTRLSALNRLQLQLRMISMQSMKDVGKMFLSHTQQFAEKQRIVEIIGRNKFELEGIYGQRFAEVNPLDLIGDVDVVPSDGSVPGGEFLDDKLNLYREIKNDPLGYQVFDTVRLLLDIMRSSGIKDPANMLRPAYKMQIMPDEMAMNVAANMNARPAGGGIYGDSNIPRPAGASEANGASSFDTAQLTGIL